MAGEYLVFDVRLLIHRFHLFISNLLNMILHMNNSIATDHKHLSIFDYSRWMNFDPRRNCNIRLADITITCVWCFETEKLYLVYTFF